jgi:hypothetical protein
MKIRIAVAIILSATLAYAGNLPTARQAVDIAKRRMSPASQDKVLRIEGRRSDADLRVREWVITFYDETRVNNALAVRVEDGQDTATKVQLRMFEDGTFDHFDRNFTGFSNKEVINLSRWKIDSDEAVARALKQPRLSEVQITEVRLILSKLSDGEVPPVWRVHLRARSKSNPGRDTSIGYIDLSAETGEVLRNETRLGKLLD